MNGETLTRSGVIFVHPIKLYFVNSVTAEQLQSPESSAPPSLTRLGTTCSMVPLASDGTPGVSQYAIGSAQDYDRAKPGTSAARLEF
jgi:hypothetical protein